MLNFKSPITGNYLALAEKDFSNRMNWFNAMKSSNELGPNWRLPSVDELKNIHQTFHSENDWWGTEKRGGFHDGLYWSSSDVDIYTAIAIDFRTGQNFRKSKKEICRVRALNIYGSEY